MIFDEGGLSSGWCFIRVVSYDGGISLGSSLKRVVFYYGCLSSGWHFIFHQGGLFGRVASNLHDLSSGISLSGLIRGVPLYESNDHHLLDVENWSWLLSTSRSKPRSTPTRRTEPKTPSPIAALWPWNLCRSIKRP